MVTVSVKKISGNSIADFSSQLDQYPRHHIQHQPWPKNLTIIPKVDFSVAYNDHAIVIKYFVMEPFFRAECQNYNDPVYQDSCVEFFVASGEDSYSNFEFNGEGVCLAQKGPERKDRNFIDTALLKQISTLHNRTFDEDNKLYDWNLTVVIPWILFGPEISERQISANFYKCGDKLPEPHYLCWSQVKSENPDFHRPEFFGQLRLE